MTKPTGRPRGRPKGAKNIPDLPSFVTSSIVTPPLPPPPAKKLAERGPCVGMTPEQRSEHFRSLAAKRSEHKGGKPFGVPRRMSVAQHEAYQAAQKPIIARIIKKMAANQQLPDDPMAVEALEKAMTVLRDNISPKDKIAAARLILDFTKAKPAQKLEHTVRSAEDILDEMATEED
jgi:hypothetical protein